jgi:hypothetical protein
VGSELYDLSKAPCICIPKKEHDKLHNTYDKAEAAAATTGKKDGTWTYREARDQAVKSICPDPCKAECIETQLNIYHNSQGISDDTRLRATKYGPPADLVAVPKGVVKEEPSL